MKNLILLCFVISVTVQVHAIPKVNKALFRGRVYSHMMPWFETPETNNGQWGIHWTMANQNPNIVDGTGRRQIAAHYYPEIGPYASSDFATIEYQLLLMKYSGIDGLLIDWPGMLNIWDYPQNRRNTEEIIRGCERIGLDFAIVYEDHNIQMAYDAGFITDKIGTAQADMGFLKDVYFHNPRYIRIDGQPLLLVFGPQTFYSGYEWGRIFEPFSGNPPTFLTLWYQQHQAEPYSKGEYPWIYMDSYTGLRHFYADRQLNIKFGVSYPGFHTFYELGGWAGPTWGLPVGPDTVGTTLDLAIEGNVEWIQLATWNDYGEGTMFEPTREFGNQFLNILQSKQGLQYGNEELELVKKLYAKRMEYKDDLTKKAALDTASQCLIDLDPAKAAEILETL